MSYKGKELENIVRILTSFVVTTSFFLWISCIFAVKIEQDYFIASGVMIAIYLILHILSVSCCLVAFVDKDRNISPLFIFILGDLWYFSDNGNNGAIPFASAINIFFFQAPLVSLHFVNRFTSNFYNDPYSAALGFGIISSFLSFARIVMKLLHDRKY